MSQDSSPGLCRIGCLLLALSGLMTPPTVEAIAQQTTPPEQAQPASVGEAEDPESVGAALKGGQGRVKLRYRYESVSQDPFELNAAASTLRTALSYQTLPFKGIDIFLEAENVAEVGNDLYNNGGAGSLANGTVDRPVVADPALTEMNQAFVRVQRGNTMIRLGRQEITIDDHRFVGNVGWRQNHQAFDAFSVVDQSLRNTTITYAFINKVHRIFGDQQPMDGHVLDVTLGDEEVGSMSLYGLLLDYTQAGDALQSTSTYGVEVTSERTVSGVQVLFEAEYAKQKDSFDNPQPLNAKYLHLQLGVQREPLTIRAGWETLGGNAIDGQFNTPLATLHTFNGWADKFTRTPTDGLEDRYISVAGAFGEATWDAAVHDFRADSSDAQYGREIDLQLTYKTPWEMTVGAKGAFYRADEFALDTNKLMFWAMYEL